MLIRCSRQGKRIKLNWTYQVELNVSSWNERIKLNWTYQVELNVSSWTERRSTQPLLRCMKHEFVNNGSWVSIKSILSRIIVVIPRGALVLFPAWARVFLFFKPCKYGAHRAYCSIGYGAHRAYCSIGYGAHRAYCSIGYGAHRAYCSMAVGDISAKEWKWKSTKA